MSTGQLIVTIAFVGLLGALHLVLRAARAPAGAASIPAPRAESRRDPVVPILVLVALTALAFAGIAFVVSVVDDGEETVAPTTQATTTAPTTTTPTTTTAAPPPPQPPPPAPAPLEPPAGTALVARIVMDPDGSSTANRNRVGKAPTVAERETGVYAVTVPGLSAQLRRRAAVRVRPADGTPGVRVSGRKIGPQADFVVFTRDARTGDFAASGFEFAVYLPKQDLEGTAGEKTGRPQLPGTR